MQSSTNRTGKSEDNVAKYREINADQIHPIVKEIMSAQLRGHCQICGREQAVRNGRIVKHGYRVTGRGEGGWLNGICDGFMYAPIEHDRAALNEMVEKLHGWADDGGYGAGHYRDIAKALTKAADMWHGQPLRQAQVSR